MRDSIINTNKLAIDYHISNIKRIQTLCDPLKYLGITTFSYMKIYKDSTYLHISNQDEWSQHYLKNISDNGEAFTTALSHIDKKILTFFWPTNTNDFLLETLKHFKLWNGITFYKKGSDFIENWSFATSPDNAQVPLIYSQHQDLLWKFIHYFMLQIQDLLNCLDKNKFAKFKNHIRIFSEDTFFPEKKILQFLDSIEDAKIPIEGTILSVREKECLELLAKGFTYKNIANHLNLSPRTVETYIHQTKQKFNVYKKIDLLRIHEKYFSNHLY